MCCAESVLCYLCDRYYSSRQLFVARMFISLIEYRRWAIGFVTNERSQYYSLSNRILSVFVSLFSLSFTVFSWRLKIIFLTFTNDIILLWTKETTAQNIFMWSLFVCAKQRKKWTNCITSCCVSWTLAEWIQSHRWQQFFVFFYFHCDPSFGDMMPHKVQKKISPKTSIFVLSTQKENEWDKKLERGWKKKNFCAENKVFHRLVFVAEKIFASIRFHWKNFSSGAPFKASPINLNFSLLCNKRSVSLHKL